MIQIGDHLAAPPLYLSYAPGRSSTLVISFSGVGNRIDPVPTPEALRLMGGDGENHVRFVSGAGRGGRKGRSTRRGLSPLAIRWAALPR